MSDNITVARPYAKAVFLLAKEYKLYSEWNKILLLLNNIISNKNIIKFLQNPTINVNKKSKFIIDIAGKDLNDHGKNLVKVLAKYRRLLYLPELYELYEKYREEAEKTMKVKIISAIKLNKVMQDQLILSMSKKIDRNITVNFNVDSKLIGGAVIKARDKVINGSIYGKILALKDYLIK